jgi:AraC-like DNA-binding protein
MYEQQFNDLDHLTDAAPGWAADFRRLRGGRFRGELRVLRAGGGQILDASFNTPIDQSGFPPSDVLTVAFGQASGLDTRWRGREVGREPLIVFRPGRAFRTWSGPSFSVRTISLSTDRLTERAHLLGLPSWEEIVGESEVLSASRELLAQLRSLTSSLLRASRTSPEMAGTPAGALAMGEEIPDLLLKSLAAAAGGRRRGERHTAARARLVIRAREMVEARPDDPPTVSDLCKALNVSVRTLQNAFRETAHSTPSSYLKSVRLTLVRRDLRAASLDPATLPRVSDIANRHGFWHMGQFARDYRKFFGELPSATLGVSPRGMSVRTGGARGSDTG